MGSLVRDIDSAFWSPMYRQIVETLGLDPEMDREATRVVHSVLESRTSQLEVLLERLESLIRSRVVLIFGCGPSLDRQLARSAPFIVQTDAPRIAADGATSALLEVGIRPDAVVTDLDGYLPDIVAASKAGATIVLHVHGDNLDKVLRWLPVLENVLPVTQTEPTSIVRNFGGFTDGDKCLFLAAAFRAAGLILIGMEFGARIGRRSDPHIVKRLSRKRKVRKLAIGSWLAEEVVRRSCLPTYSLAPVPFPHALKISPHQIPELCRRKNNELS